MKEALLLVSTCILAAGVLLRNDGITLLGGVTGVQLCWAILASGWRNDDSA